MATQSFADLGISTAVTDALARRGIDEPFAVQRLVTGDVLAGHDVLVRSPTGSGKTLAFGLPLVDRLAGSERRPAGLVLAPTRELATQIVEELSDVAAARALSIAAVYGGAGIQRQIKLARRAHILVATPGRLEDLIERGAVALGRIRVLILDEADRMLDMGFRPAVDRLVAATPEDRQTLFFSATLDAEVGRIARAYTSDARLHEQDHPPQRAADVEHRFVAVRREHRLEHLIDALRDAERGRTLVFVRTKHGADRLVKRLRGSGIGAAAMHGNKSQGQRERALAAFGAGEVDTLVATDVAARGLDVDDITHVINFDAPGDRDGYVHRVGRTGRAGRTGIGITFVDAEQARDVARIAAELELHAEFAGTGYAAAVPRPNGRPSGHSSARRPRRRRGRR